MLFSKGRVCLKLAGRDANHVCVVLEEGDFPLVWGPYVRKKKVNPAHLEPLPELLDVDKLSEEELKEKLLEIERKLTSPGKLEIWALRAKRGGGAG